LPSGVDEVGVASMRLAHRPAQPVSGLRGQDQMHVIGHQTPGPDLGVSVTLYLTPLDDGLCFAVLYLKGLSKVLPKLSRAEVARQLGAGTGYGDTLLNP
jgi:hypothetical protein